MQQPIVINVLGCRFSLTCSDELSATTLSTCYSPFLVSEDLYGSGDILYHIDEAESGWRLRCESVDVYCPTLADLLYDFEKDMTIRVQLSRPDLLFIHAAVVSRGDSAIVIAGPSGAGKSTLCWALCSNGYQYMSDELAPVHTDTGVVEGYPRALCLKTRPPSGYTLPKQTVDTDRTLHVPAAAMPSPARIDSARLTAFVFVAPEAGDIDEYTAVPMSAGEAAARLYANSLNQLAHDRFGLAAVTALASGVRAFYLPRADVDDMVRGVTVRVE